MLKKILILISILVGLLLLLFSTTGFEKSIVVSENNIEKKALPIKLNHYTDRYCNMKIVDINYTAEAIISDGKTFFFDDVGCMVSWLKEQKNQDSVVLWVWAKDKQKYIDAKGAWYSTNEITPMEYGFGAYQDKQKDYIDFETMRLKVYRGETLQNDILRKKEIGND